MQRRSAAFTLIELLIVVSIVALLLALLVPSLQGARSDTLRVVCLYNLRSLGSAVVTYAQDNAEYLPPAAQFYDGRPHREISATAVRIVSKKYDLSQLLSRYVEPRALSCPAPNRVPVVSPANNAGVIQSNYVYLWGSAPGTPVTGLSRIPMRGNPVIAADFTWYNVDVTSGEWYFGANHAKRSARLGTALDVSAGENPSAVQFVARRTLRFVRGMNAVRLSGEAGWYRSGRSRWDTLGPYNGTSAPYSAVYVPSG
ncbi:MAG: type II secretion system protein [Phycisphaerae bacterium]|nr:type II secretion system protein [Phycisphaerae bacterium]